MSNLNQIFLAQNLVLIGWVHQLVDVSLLGELVYVEEVFDALGKSLTEEVTNVLNLELKVFSLEKSHLQLVPPCYFIVIFVQFLPEFQAIKVIFLNVSLVNVYKVYLDRNTSPLATLKYLHYVIYIIYQASSQYVCLIEYLWKHDDPLLSFESSLCFFSD